MTLLLVLILVSLPRVVSSKACKQWVQKSATAALHRPLRLETLKWRWSEGILLENLVLSDSPAFSEDPLATIARLRIDLSYGALLRRQVAFDIELDGAVVNIIRKDDGRTNLEALLSEIQPGGPTGNAPPAAPRPESPAPTRQPHPLVLPVDVKARMNIHDITLQAADQQHKRSVRASAGRFTLDMPSLRHAPVTLEMTTRLELNQRKIPDPSFFVRIEKLFSAEGELQPAGATIDVKGTFPGGSLVMTGEMAKLRSELEVDLNRMFEVAAPFLPAQMAATDLSGHIGVTAEMGGDPRQELRFYTTLTTQGLKVAGGLLDSRGVGPLNLKFVGNGKLDLDKDTVVVDTGQVHIQDNSRFHWQLIGRGLKQADPEVNLTVSQVTLDLNELTALAKDFIPADVAIDLAVAERAPTLSIAKAEFTGNPLAGPHAFRMTDLAVQLPALTLAAAGNLVTARQVALDVKDTSWDARTRWPDKVALDGALNIGLIHLQQPADIQVKGLKVPSAAIRLEDIRPASRALLGCAAKISLDQSLSLDALTYSDMARIVDLRQSLSAAVHLAAQPSAELTVSGFLVQTPNAWFRHAALGAVKTDIRLDSAVSDLRIDALSPLKADLGRLTARLQMGGFLDGKVEARAGDLGFAHLQSRGRIRLDLRQLADHVLAEMKPAWGRGLKLGGKIDTTWDMAGRRPRPKELETLMNSKARPRALIAHSAFIQRFNLTAMLDQLILDIPLTGQERLTAHGISTRQPLEITLTQGLSKVDAGGGLHVDRVGALPNLGRLEKKVGADLDFSVHMADLKSLRMTQHLALDPVPLTQDFSLDLSGLDTILRNGSKAPLSAVLAHGQGVVQATLKLAKDAHLSFDNDFWVEGDLNAGGELRLVSGSRMSAKTWLHTDGLNARWGDQLTINALQSRLNLAKTFLLAQAPGSAADSMAVLPLSQAVLMPPRGTLLSADPMSRQFRDAVQGRYGRTHTVNIDTAMLNLKPAAVKLKHAMLDFHLDEGLPRMDFLQMDLLGGTLAGAWSITRSGNGFALNLQGAFTGLDTRRLLPDMDPKGPDAETEISGLISMAVPLGTKPDAVLQGMALDLKLTRIGTDALERALYAMDPAESNEEIVNQRRQLQLGTPRWIDVEIEYGNLSINGEVDVKGVPIAIPPIEGINIATLPVQADLEEALAALQPVLALLRAASAGTLAVDQAGQPRFLD